MRPPRRLAEAQRKRQADRRGPGARWNRAWPRLGEQIERLEGRRVAGRPRDHRNQGRTGQDARSGCGTSRPACGSSRKAAQERDRAIEEARQHLAECAQRAEASRWNILHAEAEIADLYLRKETFAAANRRPGQPARVAARAADRPGGRDSEDPRPAPQARREDPRRRTGRQRGPPRADQPGRPAARGLRHRAGRVGTAAAATKSSASARRCSRRSRNCGRRSTTSAT